MHFLLFLCFYSKYSRIHMYFKILFSCKCGGFICLVYRLPWTDSVLNSVLLRVRMNLYILSGVTILNIWDFWGLYPLILVFLYNKLYKYFCLLTLTVDWTQKIKVRCVCFLRNLCVSKEQPQQNPHKISTSNVKSCFRRWIGKNNFMWKIKEK